MPTTPPQIDPNQPIRETESSQPEEKGGANAPLSFVPHTPSGVPPVRIQTGRYGDLEAHELIKLLDTIEDERARSRFRESVYISVFVWIVIAWVVLYGPRYLWHAPQLINPADVLKQRDITLTDPVLSPKLKSPAPRPVAKSVDSKTLEKMRAMKPLTPPAPTPTPAAAAPTPTPTPMASNPPPANSLPPTPTPQPTRAPLAEAPTPQPTTKPNFGTPGTASGEMKDLLRGAGRPGSSEAHDSVGTGKGGNVGGGVQVLSDMQGVDFSDYLRRLKMDVYRNWIPLLPEETEPPLLKQGETYIRFTILPDGKIGGMTLEGSSHDVAIDKAAWGSIVSEGQFPPLPAQFHGPNLELRFHYMVNKGIH
jgi:outer membrane biosynthesis protein TonB